MFKPLLALLLTLFAWTSHSASKPLFSPSELQNIEKLKLDSRVFLDQIVELKKQDQNYFKHVLENTSREDLAALKQFLPKVLDLMEKSEEAVWMKNTLDKLSKE